MKLFRILRKTILILIVLSLLIVTGYTYFVSPTDYKFSTYQYETDQIPSVFNQFKIAFFSDCHIKTSDDVTRFDEIITELNTKTFDMVIFGGDLFENKPIETEKISKILKKIESQYGKFAVLGEKDDTLEVTKVLNDGGFEVLNDQQRTIYYENKTISLLGLNNADASTLINEKNKDLFQLAIAHKPDTFKSNYKNVDLQLSGHSLGGSFYIPFIGSLMSDEGCTTYNHGLYTKSNASLYVTNGIKGTSQLPYKLFASNEVKFITLIYQQQTLE